VSLIVIDVHARDVVERLITKEISSLYDFEWISTMRYYLTKSVEDPNEPTVNIEMISTTIEYGFEYLGNTSRLVVTPLTERCYRTLMGALKMNLGGAPEVSEFRHIVHQSRPFGCLHFF
jgi:dynein heavy chain